MLLIGDLPWQAWIGLIAVAAGSSVAGRVLDYLLGKAAIARSDPHTWLKRAKPTCRLGRSTSRTEADNLKRATRLLSGQDIRPALPEPTAEAYLRAVIHTPYHSYTYPSQNQTLTYPVGHRDPAGPFYGYDQWLVPGPDGVEIASTKLLVGSVCWTATALLALTAGRYVSDKADGRSPSKTTSSATTGVTC